MSWMALAAATILCGLSIVRGFQGENFMGRSLGGDYVAFYVTGKILNEYEPARIYDIGLETRLQHESVAGIAKTQMLPLAHAPYIGQVYRPFATLSYKWSYVAWLIFSLALYGAGVFLLLRSAKLSAAAMKTGFLLGLSSMPFIMETWIGGQIAVLGFFFVALFVYCRAKGFKFLAGVALTLAMFKLTIIAVPALMLLCGRRWRMLAGMTTGAAALALTSVATVGVAGCVAWFHTLTFFSRLATGPDAALRRAKYVDVGSFFQLLLGDSSAALILRIVVCGVALGILAIAWWRSEAWTAASRDLLWAATLCSGLVFNIYTPIYDTNVAVAAVALAAGVVLDRGGEDREAFIGWLVLLYIVPWVTQSFAEFVRFQPFTLVLAGFAYWALGLARRGFGEGPAQTNVATRLADPAEESWEAERITQVDHGSGIGKR